MEISFFIYLVTISGNNFTEEFCSQEKNVKHACHVSFEKTIQEINVIEMMCKRNPEASKIIFFNFFTQICKKASNYS